MQTVIQDASVAFIEQPFLKPMQISSGLITKATEARVTVRVRVGDREGQGRGSIYLSDLWAWPGTLPDRATKDAAMRGLCKTIADSLVTFCGDEGAHPLELGLRLHHSVSAISLSGDMPLLARAVCSSPFDAAIHDAAGQVLGISAFRFYEQEAAIPSADHYFPHGGTVSGVREILRLPSNALKAWWVISATDDLENDVRPAIAESGIWCFKIKLLARDSEIDAARTSEVFRAALRWGFSPMLSVDSNEGNPDAASVFDYLERLEALDPDAYEALAYLEQPTSRDIAAQPQDWSAVAKRKPILLDEGLTSLDLLPLAREQHWSGLALKTCKGHSFALVAAAWARQNGLLLSLQDLTNPGFSALHAFLIGAHISTLNGVELNSPQYTPAANQPWLPRLSGLFEPRGGQHRLDCFNAPGLGSALAQIS